MYPFGPLTGLIKFQGEADKYNFFGGGVANIPKEQCFLATRWIRQSYAGSTFEAKSSSCWFDVRAGDCGG